MSAKEAKALLDNSIPEKPDEPACRRFAIRRSNVELEFFAARPTLTKPTKKGDILVCHGYPVGEVPVNVLRLFLKRGDINKAEYGKYRKKQG